MDELKCSFFKSTCDNKIILWYSKDILPNLCREATKGKSIYPSPFTTLIYKFIMATDAELMNEKNYFNRNDWFKLLKEFKSCLFDINKVPK